MPAPRQIAEAFSSHRFHEAYDHLADDVRWVSVGHGVLHGRDAVIKACGDTLADLEGTTTDVRRLVVAAGTDVVAVDVVAEYGESDGSSLVSSCDIYEFRDGRVVAITSYGVELDADSAEEQWYAG